MQHKVMLQGGQPGPLSRPGASALDTIWLGRVDYKRAWDMQRETFLARLDGERNDSLLLLEHPHTYTLGKRSEPGDLVYDDAVRAAKGISVHEVDRGGRATYHGPGQLVGYPIMALGERYDVMRYLRKLEEVLIRAAADMGVEGHRDPDHTGVWVGRNKIGAIGVKITRGITMHGFAFNVDTDLTMFEGIVPCGLRDRGVTSVAAEAGWSPTVERAATVAAAHLADVFDRTLVWTNPALDASMEETVLG
jgi:lipoyl(octanoyl) transferase